MKRFLNLFCVTHVIQESCQTRCVLVSLVMALLLSANAFATETVRTTITIDGKEYYLYTGFNVIAYTDGNVPGHETSSLVDGDISASGVFQYAGSGSLEFSSDVPIILKGYIFDLLFESKYYPTSWTLKAKQNKEDDWDIVSSKSGYALTGTSCSVACDNSENKAYSYFYLEVESNKKVMAITELRLYGGKDFTYAFRPKKSATCTAIGYKQDCYLRSDGKYFTDQTGTTDLLEENVIIPIVPHTLEDETAHVSTCTVCGQTIVTGPHIFLDENGETLDCICGEINPNHNHGYYGDPEENDGKDVNWRVTQEEDGNYTLTISGTGRMKKSPIDSDGIPWYVSRKRSYYDKITKAVVSEGVTFVGTWAFAFLPSLKEVTFSSSVTAIPINGSPFRDNTALEKVEIPCSLEYSWDSWRVDESVIVKYHAFENQPFIDGEDGTHHQNCKCGNTTSTPESHAFTVEDVTIDGANVSGATCTEKAKYYKSCVCGALSTSEVFEYGELLDHSWGEYTLDGDQTCTNYGHKTAKCTREGCSEENKIVATGAALGHSWGEYTLDGDQTCTYDGHKTAECTREGCSEKNTIVATGAAFGHAWEDFFTVDVWEDCEHAGSKSIHCHRLGCEARKDETVIAALGHSFTEYFSNDDATTEADGTKTAECDRGCGATDTVIDEGSKLSTPTGIGNVNADSHSHAKKYLENGLLVIEKDGVKYNVAGKIIK